MERLFRLVIYALVFFFFFYVCFVAEGNTYVFVCEHTVEIYDSKPEGNKVIYVLYQLGPSDVKQSPLIHGRP